MSGPKTSVTAAPIDSGERVGAVDCLRGAALAGVLLVNLLYGFRIPLSAHMLGNDQPLGPGGSPLLFLITAVVEFKAFTIFSFLFGAGVAIQSERLPGRVRTLFLIRRFAGLFAIGMTHLLFIWNGDILTLYAVCGLLLIPLLKLSRSILLCLGLLLIATEYVVTIPVAFPGDALLRQLSTDALLAYRASPWSELLSFRWHETKVLIIPLLVLSLPRTLGLMLWGVAAWRSRFFTNRRVLRWIMAAGAVAGATAFAMRNEQLAIVPLAALYTAALLLWNPRAAWIRAGGRMALTNYLLQSIVFGFVFYGYGLGWFATIGVGQAMTGGLILYLTQLACSDWWLRRFRFGPAEWLWRCMSYLKRQPFLRPESIR